MRHATVAPPDQPHAGTYGQLAVTYQPTPTGAVVAVAQAFTNPADAWALAQRLGTAGFAGTDLTHLTTPPAAPAAVRDLYQQFTDVNDTGSSNDVAQLLDDWFVEQGFPTVVYRERPKRGRR